MVDFVNHFSPELGAGFDSIRGANRPYSVPARAGRTLVPDRAGCTLVPDRADRTVVPDRAGLTQFFARASLILRSSRQLQPVARSNNYGFRVTWDFLMADSKLYAKHRTRRSFPGP